jgi:hypothetical protein
VRDSHALHAGGDKYRSASGLTRTPDPGSRVSGTQPTCPVMWHCHAAIVGVIVSHAALQSPVCGGDAQAVHMLQTDKRVQLCSLYVCDKTRRVMIRRLYFLDASITEMVARDAA